MQDKELPWAIICPAGNKFLPKYFFFSFFLKRIWWCLTNKVEITKRRNPAEKNRALILSMINDLKRKTVFALQLRK